MSEPSPTQATAPPPPPPPPAGPLHVQHPPRPGELSLGWRITTAVTWIGVIMALAAVWNASVQIGLSTWWLGARGDAEPLPVRLFPFAAPMLVVLATINRARWLAFGGLAAAAVTIVIGIVDLGYVVALGTLEIAIGAAAAAVSLASLTGTYRAAGRPGD